jgi:hypothetical protein
MIIFFMGFCKLLIEIYYFDKAQFNSDYNEYDFRAETVRSALDIMAICVVLPKAQLELCNSVEIPQDSIPMGMKIILGAAEGEIVADADVQRSALNE